NRVGGRTWTIRNGFAAGQHAEAGGDMIDDSQTEIRQLAQELGLTFTHILRNGFGYVRPDGAGRTRIVSRSGARGWDRLADQVKTVPRRYRLAEQRWDSRVATLLGGGSVAQWLDEIDADEDLRATAVGLRGFSSPIRTSCRCWRSSISSRRMTRQAPAK